MALSKDQKVKIVEELKQLFVDSKMTVVAKYRGTSVKQMQELRKDADQSQTTVKVVKNRLVKVALSETEQLKSVDVSALKDQLLYAFNAADEAASAQSLNKYNKTNNTLEFVGAFTADGRFIGPDDVTALANLPSMEQLRGQLVGVFRAPMTNFVGTAKASLLGVVGVLNARAESIK